MSGSALAEIYFIVGMMVLILLGSGIAVFLFVRTYRREMREKASRTVADKAPAGSTGPDEQ